MFPVAIYFAIQLIWGPISYTFVFGGYDGYMPELLFYVACLRLLIRMSDELKQNAVAKTKRVSSIPRHRPGMNVLVWNSWVAHPVGGMERIALEIALQLHSHKHTVVLVGPYDKAPELRARIPAEMPYYFFDLYSGCVKRHFAAGRLLARVIRGS